MKTTAERSITTRDLLENSFDPKITTLNLSDLIPAITEKAVEPGYIEYAVKTLIAQIRKIPQIQKLKLGGINFKAHQYANNEDERQLYRGVYKILSEISQRGDIINNRRADLVSIDFTNTDLEIIKEILLSFKSTILSVNRGHYDKGKFKISTDSKEDTAELQKLYHAEYDFTFYKGVHVSDSNNTKPRPSRLKAWFWYFADSLIAILEPFVVVAKFLLSPITFIAGSLFNASKSLYKAASNYFRSRYVAKAEEIIGEGENIRVEPNESIKGFYAGTNIEGKQLISQGQTQLPIGSAICSLIPEKIRVAPHDLDLKFLIQAVPGDFRDDTEINLDDILNSVRNSVHLAIENNVQHLLVPLVGSSQFLLKRIKLTAEQIEDAKKYVSKPEYFDIDKQRNYFSLATCQAYYQSQVLQYLAKRIVETVRTELNNNRNNIFYVSYFDYDLRYDQGKRADLSLFQYVVENKQATVSNQRSGEYTFNIDPLVWLRSKRDRGNADYGLIVTRDALLGADAAYANRNAQLISGSMLDISNLLGHEYKDFEDNPAKRWKDDIAITTTQAAHIAKQRNMLFTKQGANLSSLDYSLQGTNSASLAVQREDTNTAPHRVRLDSN